MPSLAFKSSTASELRRSKVSSESRRTMRYARACNKVSTKSRDRSRSTNSSHTRRDSESGVVARCRTARLLLRSCMPWRSPRLAVPIDRRNPLIFRKLGQGQGQGHVLWWHKSDTRTWPSLPSESPMASELRCAKDVASLREKLKVTRTRRPISRKRITDPKNFIRSFECAC